MAILINTGISNTKGKTRWLEPYTSEAINRQFYAGSSWGIVEGFNLVPNGGLSVRLSVDSVSSRSIAIVPDRQQKLAFSFLEPDQPTFDLTPYTGQRVYVLLYVNYSVGVSTVYSYRVVDSAELLNLWVQSAIILGSVRVPGVGAINAGHIDLGRTVYSGAGETGSSRWMVCNTNPEFDRGLAGYQRIGAESVGGFGLRSMTSPAFVGNTALGLGEINGASTAGLTSGIRVLVPNVRSGDKLLVRFWARSQFVSGARLRLVIGALYNQELIQGNVVSFDSYGAFVEVAADADSLSVDLEVVFPNAGDNGLFVVDKFEVLKLRQGIYDANAPQIVGAREFHLGTTAPSNGAYGRIRANGQTMSLSDARSTAELDLTENGYSSVPEALSAYRLLGRAYYTAKAMNEAFPEHALAGLVTKASSTTIDIGGNNPMRAADVSASFPDISYWLEGDDQLGLSIPLTGNGVLVAYDPDESVEASRYKRLDLGVIGSIPERYTLLAYVYYDTVLSDITEIIDLRYNMRRSHRKLQLVVEGDNGAEQAHMSLAGALKLCEIAQAKGYRFISEILVKGSFLLSEQIKIPSNVKIRGVMSEQGPPLITVADLSPLPLFDLQDSDNVTIEDLNFRAANAGTQNRIVFGSSTGQPSNFTLRRCKFSVSQNGSTYLGSILWLRDQPTHGCAGRLVVEDCYCQHRNAGFAFGDSFSAPNSAAFIGTVFAPQGQGVLAIPIQLYANPPSSNEFESELLIERCKFGSTIAGIQTKYRVRVINSVLSTQISYASEAIAGGGYLMVSGCQFNFDSFSTATPTETIVVTGTSLFRGSIVDCRFNLLRGSAAIELRCININLTGSTGHELTLSALNIFVGRADVGSSYGVFLRNFASKGRLVMSGVSIGSDDGAGTSATTYGVFCQSVDSSHLSGLHVTDVTNDRAVTFDATSDNNLVTGLFVQQQNGVGAGFTNAGSGNTLNSVKVV